MFNLRGLGVAQFGAIYNARARAGYLSVNDAFALFNLIFNLRPGSYRNASNVFLPCVFHTLQNINSLI